MKENDKFFMPFGDTCNLRRYIRIFRHIEFIFAF